ncbi:class I SAM-dependent methyltransferase [Amycolatopsis thermoflava]|uniref:class I SAM-dependent methyltransferase n=1 Tax=Amycolatopsis thermoflava TaxID=84480 RepID=UPI0036523A25
MRTLVQRLRPDLDPLRETLLLTLYARALDSKLPHPILGDADSAALADTIEYDFARLKLKPSLICGTALRAKKLDDAVRGFVAAHPRAVVLDLGCGLDTRVLRCDPPAGVGWYDIDFPDVVALRTQLLPDRSERLGVDLTEPGWLDPLPRDRPAMIVAEGLLPFLPGDTFQRMTRELTAHFDTGELAINGYTRFAAWSMKYHPAIKAIGITAAQGFDDPRTPETWNAGLTLVEEQLLTRAPEVADFPQPLRAATRLISHSAALSRQGTRILRYRF